MAQATLHPPVNATELAELLTVLTRRVGRLARRAAAVELDLDTLEADLAVLVDRLVAEPDRHYAGGRTKAGRRHGLRSLGPAERSRLVELAAHGVQRLEFARQICGGARVRIDAAELPLPPALADLFEILIDGEGSAPDGLVPMKSMEHIARRLTERCGRPARPHAVRQNIHRVRLALWQRGVNPFFVQTGPAGARLAWHGRRGAEHSP